MYNKIAIRFDFFDIQNNQGLGKGYHPQPLPCEHTFLSRMAFGVYGSVNSKHSHLPSGYFSSCRSVTPRYLLDALTNWDMKPLMLEAGQLS